MLRSCVFVLPHLAYLGQMLEKGGGYVIRIFPDGLVLSPNPLKWHILFTFVVLKNVFVSHTVHNRDIWGICKGYVVEWYTCRIVPEVWGLVPIG